MEKISSKPRFLIGIDEVGRGPIAGAVAVGAFCIPIKNLPKVRRIFKGVKESKQLSEQQRESWFIIIQQIKKMELVDFAVAFQSEKVIDTKGLSFAIKNALKISLNTVTTEPDKVQILLDGGLKAPVEFINQKTIIKGDEKELVIALASICAKVLRDRKMNTLAKKYPKYGFEKHKGYGTRAHYVAIKKYGRLSLHRKSFLDK
ncbi:MAG TPA: ribonuclease HII [Candidatus Paceibacterota bacterium]|jgi:ribonuclease HII|nr:ribonuclease HII [Candidatus Paceibacterota bacterium]